MYADYYVITLYRKPFSRFITSDSIVRERKCDSYQEMEETYAMYKRIATKYNYCAVRVTGYWIGTNTENIHFWTK